MKHAWTVLAGALAIGTVAAVLAQAQPAGRRVIHVSAERFAFTPSRITVDAGEEVELRITSDDTNHGFRLAGTSTSVIIPKRGKGEAAVVIRLDTPGKYRFECHRMCGAGHIFMHGELIVRATR
jgi:cytochrome c oxidase subunit 2